jgi:hypothetical protein
LKSPATTLGRSVSAASAPGNAASHASFSSKSGCTTDFPFGTYTLVNRIPATSAVKSRAPSDS